MQTSFRNAGVWAIGGAALLIAGCSPSSPSSTTPPASTSPVKRIGPVPGKEGAIAVVDEPIFEFGTAEVNEEFQHVFTIRNKGTADLTLMKGPPSCTTCTSFEVDRLAVKPGESAKATVKWKVGNSREKFRQYAPLMTNDPDNPELRLMVVGTVSEVLKVHPLETWDMGELKEGEPTTFSGSVSSPILEQFKILALEPSLPRMKAEAIPLTEAELKELKAKSGYKIQLELAPGMPVGDFRDPVTVKTDVREGVKLTFDVKGRRVGPVQIYGPYWSPDKMLLNLKNFPAKKGMKATLSLFSKPFPDDPEKELQFEEVTSDPPEVKVSIAPDPKFQGKQKRYLLTFEIPPEDKQTMRTRANPAIVTVKTNHPYVGTIRFRLHYNAL